MTAGIAEGQEESWKFRSREEKVVRSSLTILELSGSFRRDISRSSPASDWVRYSPWEPRDQLSSSRSDKWIIPSHLFKLLFPKDLPEESPSAPLGNCEEDWRSGEGKRCEPTFHPNPTGWRLLYVTSLLQQTLSLPYWSGCHFPN